MQSRPRPALLDDKGFRDRVAGNWSVPRIRREYAPAASIAETTLRAYARQIRRELGLPEHRPPGHPPGQHPALHPSIATDGPAAPPRSESIMPAPTKRSLFSRLFGGIDTPAPAPCALPVEQPRASGFTPPERPAAPSTVRWGDAPTASASAPAEKTESVPTPAERLADDRRRRRERLELSDLREKYRHAQEEIEQLEEANEVLLQLQGVEPSATIEPDRSRGANEGCAILQWSDWHVEERIDRGRVNGLNEFNPDIAKRRAHRLAQNSLTLVEKEREALPIDTLLLWLGGDFINGYIHEELTETNFLSPTEATEFAQELLIENLTFLVEHGKFRRILAVCSFGNHGRTTARKRISSGYKNSYEWLMYRVLARRFQELGAPIEWVIPTSDFAYVDVFGRSIRAFHGDTIRYQGGIGGLTIPLIKALHRYDKQRRADMNLLGHFHQLIMPCRNAMVNGSLVGFSPYAESIGAEPEPPMQGFRVLDAKRGFTVHCPIFCE